MKRTWWKESVVYQVYPASFHDTNGDGWGDVPGITAKLDYLKDLGIDVVWTSPIFKSPQVDMGYDISDYTDIDIKYGTLADVDELIAEMKKRKMRLLMDLVVNHTSDQHPWFIESRSSVNNPKRDWYIWKKPSYDANGNRKPPNNWYMLLGSAYSAWTWDEKTQEYYLSLFTSEQPDLNWENPKVRDAVHDVLRFWLDRGVAGFRMDVINLISKDQQFPDAEVSEPGSELQNGVKHFANGPRLHEFLKEINRKVLSHYDTMTVGEMPFIQNESEILKIVGEGEEELNMIFGFELFEIDRIKGESKWSIRQWHPSEMAKIFTKWQNFVQDKPEGWITIFNENHDLPRSVSRFTDDSDNYRDAGSKLICLTEATLSGTLFVYQGQELGMRNVPEDWSLSEFKDVETQNWWNKTISKHPHNESELKEARHVVHCKARDHARTPVQWSGEANAGFCKPGVTPWMRVNNDYRTVNSEAQRQNSSEKSLSVFQFWKWGLELRKKHKDAFVYGGFKSLSADNSPIFAYERIGDDSRWIIALNYSGDVITWTVPSSITVQEWVISNHISGKSDKPTEGTITLQAWEGILGRCSG